MDEKQLAEIIGQEVSKELAKTLHKAKIDGESSKFKVLGLLSHLGKGLSELVDALCRMAQENLSVMLWCLPEIDDQLNITQKVTNLRTLKLVVQPKDMWGLPEYSSLENIFVGAFGFEIADKIIGLHDDDPIVSILLQGLLHNVSVDIITPFPMNGLSFEYRPSGSLAQEVRSRIAQLTAMGFGFLDQNDLQDKFLKHPFANGLVTESYIEALRGKTTEIRLPKSAIVTPLAMEKAHELQIRIMKF